MEQWPKIIAFLGFEPWPEPKTPAQKLRAARRRQGLSIADAATVLSVAPSTLWWWEHGRKPHRREHKARIAAFVGGVAAESSPGTPDGETVSAAVEPISSLIRHRRRELRLSQQQAAKEIGVNTWTVLLWEQGRHAPTPRFYPGLIRFLGHEPWPEPHGASERLKAERLRRGLTRRQLAAMLDVDLGSISKWDGRPPSAAPPEHRED